MTLAFLTMVWFTSIFRVLNYAIQLIWRLFDWKEDPNFWTEGSLAWINATCFSAAVTVNIFNWIYQTLRIEQIRTSKRVKQRYIHIMFVVSLVVIFATYFALWIQSWTHGKDYYGYKIFTLIYGVNFIIIGNLFMIVGIVFWK